MRTQLAVGLALAATASFTPATTTAGVMSPAIGAHPRYQVAGPASAATTFKCQTTVPAGCYGPSQIRGAYGINALHADGAGQTIVIVDAYQSPTITHDLRTFDALFGLPDPAFDIVAPDGLTDFDQSNATQVSWAGEISLDVEWAHAIAPAAKIELVLAKTSDDADLVSATRYAVDHHLGNVISLSFGEAEQCMTPAVRTKQHRVFADATRRGITVLAASGDEGAAQPTCDGTSVFKAASTPATDPHVTAVGGTRLDADGATGAYRGETVWNEPAYQDGAGGGLSTVYPAPNYQRGLGLRSRGIPDVAYNAAIVGGVLSVWSTSGLGPDVVFRFGGTSAGSPQWAGLIALADQIGDTRLGALNDQLYRLARTHRYDTLFHDVTTGDNTYHGTITVPGYAASRGYDLASGLGSPKADVLIPALLDCQQYAGGGQL